jgi:hypothetical protein
MRTLALLPSLLCMSTTLTLLGCSGGSSADGNGSIVYCNVPRDAGAKCMAYVDPKSDTYRLSILAECSDGGGELVEACPDENLIGVCEQPQDIEAAWTLARVVRVHHYLQPGLATPEAIDTLENRCGGGGTWTPASRRDDD